MQEQDYSSKKLNIGTWKTILHHAGSRKHLMVAIVLCGMMTGVFDLLSQLLNTWAIDNFIAAGSLTGFPVYIVLALAVQLLFAAFTFGFCRSAGRLESHLTADVREAAFSKLQTMDFSYFDHTAAGYLLSRLTSDVSRTMETVSWSMIDVGWGIMSVLCVLVGMMIVNWRLGLILVAVIPFMAILSVFFQRRILRFQRQTRRLNSMITASFNECIMGARTTKTLVREELNEEEFVDLTGQMKKATMRAVLNSSLYMPAASLLVSITTAIVLLRGGHSVQAGLLTLGQLNFFMNIGNMMFEPIRAFAAIFAEFQSCQAAAERVADVLTAQPAIQDTPEATERYGDLLHPRRENWEPITGQITFDHVSFSYAKGETVLEDFNLQVEPGQSIALVGATGSGKSTIVNLICRFYEPQKGRILIDGKDIRERSQLWLQSNLGYVLQTPHLFSGTIRDNIRYGKLDATDAEIRRAAALVGADAFIEQLEKGYDTEVGEGGSLLSVGQKQLLSFARAILADPAIFVLDEATSSIDTESEQKIQRAIDTLLEGRTSFIIAHRLSTIRNADRILVIDKGRIVEQGTHRDLMRQKGRYYKLYTNQFLDEQSYAAWDAAPNPA